VSQANGVITVAFGPLFSGVGEIVQITIVATTSGSPLTVAQRLLVGPSSIDGIVLTFSEPLDPVQASNPINYSLTSQGDGFQFNVPVPLKPPVYDATAQTVTLIPSTPLMLGNVYQLEIDGPNSAGLTDLAGNLLAGNTASGPSGPYVTTISRGVSPVDSPPVVVAQHLLVSLSSIDGIVLTFNEPLNPIQATNSINYSLKTRRHGHQFTVNTRLKPPIYDSTALTVTLLPSTPLKLGKVYQLEIDGPNSAGLTDLAGNLLVGNTASGPSGPYVSQISRGVVPPAPRQGHAPKSKVRTGAGTSQARLIESVSARRVLEGPATTSTGGQLLGNYQRTGFSL